MRYQFLVLFVCNLGLWSMGNGLLPLLPVYALERGATPATAGAAIACAYAALAGSNLLAGNFAGILRSRKRLLGVAGLLSALPLALLGHADRLWQFTVLLSALWFCAGLATAMIHVLTGDYANPEQRGRSFALMALALPLGALIGGPALGALAAQQGFPAMFRSVAAAMLLWPLLALSGLPRDRYTPWSSTAPDRASSKVTQPIVRLLLIAALLAAITTFIGRLATSLAMHSLQFDPGAIGGTLAAGALASLPLLPLIGVLSDHFGRRRLLAAAYLLGALGTLSLAFAQALWQFWLASALLALAVAAGNAVMAALAADLLPPYILLGRVLPQITAMGWLAAMIGFAGGGYLLEQLGLFATAAGAATLAVVAAGLLSRLPLPPQSASHHQARAAAALQQHNSEV
jgi:MFS family permease